MTVWERERTSKDVNLWYKWEWRENFRHCIFVIEALKGGCSAVLVNSCTNQRLPVFSFLLHPTNCSCNARAACCITDSAPGVCSRAYYEGKSHLNLPIMQLNNWNLKTSFLLPCKNPSPRGKWNVVRMCDGGWRAELIIINRSHSFKLMWWIQNLFSKTGYEGVTTAAFHPLM